MTSYRGPCSRTIEMCWASSLSRKNKAAPGSPGIGGLPETGNKDGPYGKMALKPPASVPFSGLSSPASAFQNQKESFFVGFSSLPNGRACFPQRAASRITLLVPSCRYIPVMIAGPPAGKCTCLAGIFHFALLGANAPSPKGPTKPVVLHLRL